jgi:hypothetical protein
LQRFFGLPPTDRQGAGIRDSEAIVASHRAACQNEARGIRESRPMSKDETCYWMFCFVPPMKNASNTIFGFSEFMTALALLVVLYTIADVRCKLWIAISPGGGHRLTFVLITIIGVGTLET